jgi:hypothetical protein
VFAKPNRSSFTFTQSTLVDLFMLPPCRTGTFLQTTTLDANTKHQPRTVGGRTVARYHIGQGHGGQGVRHVTSVKIHGHPTTFTCSTHKKSSYAMPHCPIPKQTTHGTANPPRTAGSRTVPRNHVGQRHCGHGVRHVMSGDPHVHPTAACSPAQAIVQAIPAPIHATSPHIPITEINNA